MWWAQCACDGHSVVGSGDGRSRSGLSSHKRWSGLVHPHVAQFPGTEGCLKRPSFYMQDSQLALRIANARFVLKQSNFSLLCLSTAHKVGTCSG